jgi:hypothetical protein
VQERRVQKRKKPLSEPRTGIQFWRVERKPPDRAVGFLGEGFFQLTYFVDHRNKYLQSAVSALPVFAPKGR